MTARMVLLSLLFAASPANAAAPAAQPVIKPGPCPAGYTTGGDYCQPGKNARFAVAKQGGCPAGYSPSGGFCLAGKSSRRAFA